MNTSTLDLQLEPLEVRQMLAGSVTVSFNAAGDLRVTGDNQSNTISITIADSSQSNSKVFRFSSADTSINGRPIGLPVRIFRDDARDLRISMRGGDDGVAIRNEAPTAFRFRNGVINGGAGNDGVDVHFGVDFGKNLTIALAGGTPGESGFDQRFFHDQNEVGGNLVVRGARTADQVTLLGGTIGGRTSVSLGAGDDTASFTFTTMTGPATVNLGAGVDTANFGQITGGMGTSPVEANDTLRINMGAGNDTLNFNALNARRPVRAFGGSGQDTFTLANFTPTDNDVIRGFEP